MWTGKRQKLCFRGSAHKLRSKYAEIVCDKSWNTLSEETLERASATWSWLNHYNLSVRALYSGLYRIFNRFS